MLPVKFAFLLHKKKKGQWKESCSHKDLTYFMEVSV